MKKIFRPIGQNIRKISQKAKTPLKKVKMPEKEASLDWVSGKKDGAGSIFKRSTRRFSHFAIMFIFILVIAVGLFTRPTNEKKEENPYLFGYTDEQVNEVTYIQSVATIGGVVDEKIGQQAYEVASKKDTAPVLAVSGNGFISKPTLSETRSTGDKPKNDIQEYIVQNGDTLSTIAAKFSLTSSSIRWANNIEDSDSVKPGQKFLIPPTIGVLYLVQEGDSLESIAGRFGGSVAMIVAQNDLYGEDIKAGMRIMIPDGVGPEEAEPEPEPEPAVPTQRTRVASYSGSSYNRFPYGWCTYYVASRRNVPWSGNAGDWYWNAQRSGYSVGRAPSAGAIMVTGESGWGHVAYVESVNGGSFTVSEMNYNGWGVVSRRTISAGQVPLYGFIY
ncbi:MAG: LysM peptidoglycan-binding domain-containing protein [Patescibacteria group bacterium]